MTSDNDGQKSSISVEERLGRLERALPEQQRPWYKRASDVFSLLAVTIAAISVLISLTSQREQVVSEDRRHLSTIFNEIGSVNAEMAKLLALPISDKQKEFAGVALNNQLWTLLQDADRLAGKFQNELGPLELAILGANFAHLSDLDRAEHYLAGWLQADVSPIQRAMAHRTLANFIVLKGKEHFGKAHENYRKAVAVLEGTTSLHAGRELANIHIMQARLNIAEHNFDDARTSLDKAWAAIRAQPCMEDLTVMADVVRRYAKVVQAPEPQPSEPCVFIDDTSRGVSVDHLTGKFQATNGTLLEIDRDGTQLRIRLPGQSHELVQVRDGMYEFRGLPGYFVLFGGYRNKKFQSITLYQPNGVFFAERV